MDNRLRSVAVTPTPKIVPLYDVDWKIKVMNWKCYFGIIIVRGVLLYISAHNAFMMSRLNGTKLLSS